jgi:hypothetical protein
MLWAASALNKQTPKRLSPTRVDFIRAGVGWLLAETASLQVGDVIASDTRVAYCQSGDCLAAPLALTSSWKSKGALGALLRIRAQDLSNPSKPTEKELISAKNWKDSDAAKQRSPGLCRDKAEARRRNHLSYTMIPPDTGCSPLCLL